jgi:DNA processing protein
MRLLEKHEWPALLHQLPTQAQPKQLWMKGEPMPADALSIAIVGTRKCTSYGKEAAYDIAFELAKQKIVIVSGLAVGIDTVAHQAALDAGGRTIAVLGSGLDPSVLFPSQNRVLAQRIAQSGGMVLSEYDAHQKATLWTFPQRNRIIAGIAKATLVIEAREKSGALITARFATEYNRDLFALPGSVFAETSRGAHWLLRQGALPISHARDILEALGIVQETTRTENAYTSLSLPEQHVMNALAEPLSLDEIIKRSSRPAHEIMTTTTMLEIKGLIRNMGGGIYRKV